MAGPQLDNIPDEMKAWAQWILWRWVEREGKRTKVPFSAKGHYGNASVNKPETFATYERVVTVYEASQGWARKPKFDGIAFVFTEADPFAGIDLDDVVDAETGLLIDGDLLPAPKVAAQEDGKDASAPWVGAEPARAPMTAGEIIATFDTYTERSPSGTGVKLIFQAQKTSLGLINCQKKPHIETYDRGRLFTVTGNIWPGASVAVEERHEVYAAWHREVWPPEPARPVAARVGELVHNDDNKVLEIAERAAPPAGPKFSKLWRGDYSDYPNRSKDPGAPAFDHSAGDLALCNYLRFYTCGDKGQIDRMFQASGMMRDKWFASSRGGRTYGSETVDRACNSSEYYDPQRGRAVPSSGGRRSGPPPLAAPGAPPPGSGGTGSAGSDAPTGDQEFGGFGDGGGEDRRLDDFVPPPDSETAGVSRAKRPRPPSVKDRKVSLRDDSDTAPEAGGDGNEVSPEARDGRIPPRILIDGSYLRTHGGNALRFVDEYEDFFRYDHQRQWWCIWCGTHWEIDIEDIAGRTCWQMMRRLHVGREFDTEAFKWMLKSDTPDAVSSCLNLAKRDPRVSTNVNKFDLDIWLLNVANGTVDLRNGQLKPHTRADMITHLAPVTYVRGASAPTWLKALEVWQPDVAIREFLQRAIGYALSGSVGEQTLFFLYGLGSNGKSVFINTIMSMLGTYAHKASYEMLCDMGRSSSGPTPEISDLKGKRLVVPTEVEGGQKLKESMVKDLTGGDAIPTRDMYGKTTYSFLPQLTLVLYGNHRPPVKGVDEGIWRRLPLIPFDTFIAKADRDQHLMEKLAVEMSGILNWAIDGCLMWQRDGLKPPASVMEATALYRETQDRIGQFIQDRCKLVPKAFTASSVMRKAYEAWGEEEGEPVAPTKMFAERMNQSGVVAGRGSQTDEQGRSKQVRGWIGIQLPDPNALGLDLGGRAVSDPVSTGEDPFAEGVAEAQAELELDAIDAIDATFPETPTRTRAHSTQSGVYPSIASSTSSEGDVVSSGLLDEQNASSILPPLADEL